MKELNIVILISFCAIIILFISCNGDKMMKDKNSSDEKTRYFAGFAGKSHPVITVEEIRKEDTLSRRTYCVACYNDIGQIITVKKILNSKLFFLFEYEYYENGKIKCAKVTVGTCRERLTRHQPDKNAGSFEALLMSISKLAFAKISLSVFASYSGVSVRNEAV